MAWKHFVNPLAVGPRRRVVATALVYGLSLAVRFTSAAGEETEAPPLNARGICPMTSIMINDGGRAFDNDWPRPAQSLAFHSWPPASRRCSASCEGPKPSPLMLNCPAP
jgi:hypothetical protein